ncbi:hypothetical protein GOODEAATRI_027701 [Goodea atripinnis]|uniref:Uncharacterized protein n=1 Tax=Goodea atripinnis TaxID=208336 RepID=A0ABV0PS84_9TELE
METMWGRGCPAVSSSPTWRDSTMGKTSLKICSRISSNPDPLRTPSVHLELAVIIFFLYFTFSHLLDQDHHPPLHLLVWFCSLLNLDPSIGLLGSTMIGVNSIHSSGRNRSRSLCSVRTGRDMRESDFRYPRAPRSRSLKPLAFPDLLGKSQDRQQHPQSRKKKVEAGDQLHEVFM